MSPLTATLVLAVEDTGIQNILPDAAELVWGAVSFILLFALISKFAFPKLTQTLDERSARIQGQIEEAETVRSQAEQLRVQYEQQLADARNQAAGIVDDARAQAERLRADMLSRAEEEAAQLVARAREDVHAERGRLVQDLRGQVAALSVELAGKIVQRELDETRHQQLVDQYINELSGLN